MAAQPERHVRRLEPARQLLIDAGGGMLEPRPAWQAGLDESGRRDDTARACGAPVAPLGATGDTAGVHA